MEAKYKTAELNNRKLLVLRPLAPETLKSLRDYYRAGLTYSINQMDLLRLLDNGGVKSQNGGVNVDAVTESGGVNPLEN